VRSRAAGLAIPCLLLLGACGGHVVSIDWVNFVQLNGITYLAFGPAGSNAPALGRQVGLTKRKLADNETDPGYRLKDGDAAFLEAGTPIFALADYRSTFRVEATLAGALTIFEADTNPKASTGADLLDLAGKVDYIGIGSGQDSSQLGAIRDPAVVTRLVAIVLDSPVDQSIQPHSNAIQYFIGFHFRDGTQSLRSYWPSTGELSRGIRTAPEFGHLILAALPSPAA
jgi:hypothetical protein